MHRISETWYEDAMIAATAKVHRLTVVTRNVAVSEEQARVMSAGAMHYVENWKRYRAGLRPVA